METSAKTIIVGAGPAGLAAAIASGTGSLILERNTIAGKKLLLSGSGQCNFTNNLNKEEFLHACGTYSHFLKPALYRFDNDALIDLLSEAGCPVIIRPDGKAFPASLRADDVRSVLVQKALAAKSDIRYQTRIVKAIKMDRFRLETENGERFICDNLILAGGGSSYPQTGSDGSINSLAKALGHNIIEPKPALASVSIASFKAYQDCSGVSLRNVAATFITKQKKYFAQGDLLWTHTGLSGPLILNNSYLLDQGDKVVLCLLPRAEDRILEILQLYPRQSLLQALKRFLVPESLLAAILTVSGIDLSQKCGEVRKSTRQRLIMLLSHLEFTIAAVESLQTAMATCGGIPLSEVKAHSLASRICPGLNFAGEMLDYNLPTGGFNIQIAVSTGYLAGISAASTSKKSID